MQNLIGKVIVFTDKIEDMEAYPEAGMRARISRIDTQDTNHADLHEHLYKIVFDYSEFDSLNKTLESSNYYDKNQNPCLTAREANMYDPQETIYFGSPKLWPFEEYFTLVDAASVKLTEEFKASGETDYVAWLEKKVLENA